MNKLSMHVLSKLNISVLGAARLRYFSNVTINAQNVDSIDPRQVDFIQDPYPILDQMRSLGPVHWNNALQGWVVTSYENVRTLLADTQNLTSDRLKPGLDYLEKHKSKSDEDRKMFQELRHTFQSWVVFNDPPDHTRLRKLMDKAFRKKAIKNLTEKIEIAAETLLDEAIKKTKSKGEMEFIKDFANPLPARVIADMLGVPHEDMPKLVEWSNGIANFVLVSRNDKDKYKNAASSLRNLRQYFSKRIEFVKASMPPEPEEKENVLLGMIRSTENNDKLSLDELIASSILLIFAGHETTTHLIANGVYTFIQYPEQQEKLRKSVLNNDENSSITLKNAVDEVLRYDGPSLANVRLASHDFSLFDKPIKKGDRLFLFSCSANRDPEKFDNPNVFNIDRDNAKRHLTFGFGNHFCIGGPLARLEGEIAFREVFKRFKSIELNVDDNSLLKREIKEPGKNGVDYQPPFIDLIITRGMKSLPIRYSLN